MLLKQFNRLVRSHTELIEAFVFLHLAALLEVRKWPYEALDSSAIPTRDRKRRGLAGQADMETVYEKLFNTFGLWRERPHELQGLRARLAARVALHNFCVWLNEHLGRPRLAFADLLGW